MLAPVPRPYRVDDLPRLATFLGRCNLAADLLCPVHPGDLRHLLTNTMRGKDPALYCHMVDGADGDPLAVILLSTYGAFDVVVHPDRRGGDFERDLLRWGAAAEQSLLNRLDPNAEEIMSDGLTGDQARHSLLAELGFTRAPEPYMALTVRELGVPWPEAALPAGFTIRQAAGLEEADAIGAVHSSAFKSNWPPGLYRTVMETPGFTIEHELLAVAPDGELAAFLIYWPDPVSQSALFEPVGTAESYQRRGLSRALMTYTLGLMRDAGMTHAVVKHMLDNPASSRAYESLGFVRKAVYTEYALPRVQGETASA